VRSGKESVLRGENRVNRGASKGKLLLSDHPPLVIDLDSLGSPFDAGWAAADLRIAARLRS